jgi:hypothetical protein
LHITSGGICEWHQHSFSHESQKSDQWCLRRRRLHGQNSQLRCERWPEKQGCQERRPPPVGDATSERSPDTHKVRPQHTHTGSKEQQDKQGYGTDVLQWAQYASAPQKCWWQRMDPMSDSQGGQEWQVNASCSLNKQQSTRHCEHRNSAGSH